MTTIPSSEAQRQEILEELRSMSRLRRGQISEQFLHKKGADGQTRLYGPYFVWQSSVRGRKRSQRIPPEEVEQAREDLQAYERFQGLCERLLSLMEQNACGQGVKKKRTTRAMR